MLLPSDCKPLPRAAPCKGAGSIDKFLQSNVKMSSHSKHTATAACDSSSEPVAAPAPQLLTKEEVPAQLVAVLLLPIADDLGHLKKVLPVFDVIDTKVLARQKTYVKLTRSEKETVVALADSMKGRKSLNKTIDFIRNLHQRFSNLNKSSLARYRALSRGAQQRQEREATAAAKV